MFKFLRGRASRPNHTLAVVQSKDYLKFFSIHESNKIHTISNYVCLEVAENIKSKLQILRKLKLKTNLAAIAISDSLTIRKSIVISESLNQTEQHELAQIEVEKYIQGSIDTVFFDYQVIQSTDKCEMLLVIAKRQSVLDIISHVTDLGLRVNLVDIESNCILRVFGLIASNEHQQVSVAWLDVSHGKIRIYIIRNMQLVFINVESYSFEKQLTEDTVVNEILSKIERNFKYFYASKDNLTVSFVYLFGNFQSLNLLGIKLNVHLQCSVFTPNLLEHMQVANDFIINQLSKRLSSLVFAWGLSV